MAERSLVPRRLSGNPLLHRDSTPGVGANINGPSLIAAPPWVTDPLGRYYLYFAHHRGTFIRLAVADRLDGPWRVHQPGALQLADSYFPTVGRRPHIASPDVLLDGASATVRMYFHGLDTATREQHTRVALSRDGVHFEARPELLGRAYFRVFRHGGWWYALAMPGILYRSADGLTGFERGPKLFDNAMRHSALLQRDGELLVFFSRVGDCPERILCSTIALEGDWHSWRAGPASEVLEPEESWEGAGQPLVASVRGWVDQPVRQLRDPAIFQDGARTYLLYAVAGESGIAIAELDGVEQPQAGQGQRSAQTAATGDGATLGGRVKRVATRVDPGLLLMRQALVAIAAALGSFATALWIRHAAGLSDSVEVLAVALALTLGRVGQRPEHRGWRGRALALALLPLVALGANEIGTTIFRHPDLGDTLFVLAMSATIWIRRFGDLARRIATLATLPLVAMLIVPVPVVSVHGGGGDQRLWSALIAVVALAWVTLTNELARGVGLLPAQDAQLQPVRASAGRAGGRRRIAPSTKMALQMGVALGAAFAVGRSVFGTHWTWVVLTAFIVCSGNRGREDVLHKAAMRLLGAGVGTLAATALAGAFPAGDAWSIVALFVVLAFAVWLRPRSYAYWAAGMTAALALLYGYYGQHGGGLLATRLEAIVVGAALALASSWLLLPIRTSDVVRRDIAAALGALDGYLAALLQDVSALAARDEHFRRTVVSLEHHSRQLRSVPRRLRAPIDRLPAIAALERCAELVPAATAALSGREPRQHLQGAVDDLRERIGGLRGANARKALPDPRAWNGLVDGLRELPRIAAAGGAPAAAAPARVDRLRASSERVLAYVNRVHGTAFQLVCELPSVGSSLSYSLVDPSGRRAQLTWSRDPAASAAIGEPSATHEPGQLACGRTPSGFPYALRASAAPAADADRRA
jgi:hypothetical protein